MFNFGNAPKNENEKEGGIFMKDDKVVANERGEVLFTNEVKENRVRGDRNPEDFESPFKEYTPNEDR